jgi:hypothetical protein
LHNLVSNILFLVNKESVSTRIFVGTPVCSNLLLPATAQQALKKTFLDEAIAKAGGNIDKGRTLYSAYGSSGQVFIRSARPEFRCSFFFYIFRPSLLIQSHMHFNTSTTAVGFFRQNIRAR